MARVHPGDDDAVVTLAGRHHQEEIILANRGKVSALFAGTGGPGVCRHRRPWCLQAQEGASYKNHTMMDI